MPSGFLTGRSTALLALRKKVLERHHLACAYQLPSAIFPGAMLVTYLLFFRSRGGEFGEVDAGDQFVLDGNYFADSPDHILGTELGKDVGEAPQAAKASQATAAPDALSVPAQLRGHAPSDAEPRWRTAHPDGRPGRGQRRCSRSTVGRCGADARIAGLHVTLSARWHIPSKVPGVFMGAVLMSYGQNME